MLLQVLDSDVTELALQFVLVLLGVEKTTPVGALPVKCCGGGGRWKGGRRYVASRYSWSCSHPDCSASAPS